MALVVAAVGLLAVTGYMSMYGNQSSGYSSVTQALRDRSDNGYQFRDQQYSDVTVELSHPDVVNNNYGLHSETLAHDHGIYGTPRTFKQLYSGLSNITQVGGTVTSTHLVL